MTLSAPIRHDFIGLSAGIAMVGMALGTVLPLSTLRLEAQGAGTSLIGLLVALQAMGVSLGLVFNLVESWVNDILPDHSRGRWIAIHCTIFTLCQLSGPLLVQLLPESTAFLWAAALLTLAAPMCMGLSQHGFAEPGAEQALLRWWQLLWLAPAIAWGTALFALFDALVLSLLPLHARQQGMDIASSLVSARVKQALLMMAERHLALPAAPCSAVEWALLAESLGVRVIQISERDTRHSARQRAEGEFVNTWSVDGFVAEARRPLSFWAT